MDDYIFFGGDSFTWGEGLELYINNPFWVNERNFKNGWLELETKQTDETICFRETNRFAGIVSKYFNTKQLVLNYNGGGFDASPTFFDLHSDKNPKTIIYQFTTFDRFNLHFSRFCKCDFCKLGGVRPYMLYLDCLRKLLNNQQLTEHKSYHLNWLVKNKNIHLNTNINDDTINQFIPLFLESMTIFVNDYINKWNKITDVYLIDSWDFYTSKLIETIPEIKSKLIPLKGYDNEWYYRWRDWELTFPHRRIENEFPATQNGHPTLIQHQYIAESIIHAMKK
jgi:hypothetical protein